jgi:acyl-CoA thioester hydrolase
MPRAARGASTSRPEPHQRTAYHYFRRIPTRWMDNDVYGHVNNVVYYSYFDTVVNAFLVHEGGLDIESGPVIGLCVESQCRYLASVAFPDLLDAGLRVAKIGRSSVRYEVGIFRAGEKAAAAQGHFVHVFVDRITRKPVDLPDRMRAALTRLC